MPNFLPENLARVRRRIAAAATRSGRRSDEIKLIAVSKTRDSDVLQAAAANGATIFGENKVQEAAGKIEKLGRAGLEWHLIGHLQANKARQAVRLFDCVQTLDSVELAARLERICTEENRQSLPVLVQVDLADEPTKNGVLERDLPALAEFLRACERLRFDGLMTIPPFDADVERTRPFFKRLRALRDEIVPGGALSMGMSGDFEMAIEEGATVVRVGTAIFGARDKVDKLKTEN